jgi:hypothetical protein
MVAEGYGKQLYDRRYQGRVLREHYSEEDATNLLDWMMGSDDDEDNAADEKRVGGPLYPPVHCFVIYPLSLMPPRLAYRVSEVLNLLEALLAGWAIVLLSHRRVWLPIASLLVMIFFGFSNSMHLGQNATLTLAILLWGWAFMSAGREVCGGAIWGMLAFKPVWALSFFFVPLLTRRWRAGLAMGLTGTCLAALTLPVVGWHSWMDWLQVGKEAAAEYRTDKRWIRLSRDVLGLPRRWNVEMDPRWADIIGWGMLGAIFVSTVALAIARRRQAQAATGPIAAFVLLGMWLCCFHFMYYDVLLTVLPLAALLLGREFFPASRLARFIPIALVVIVYLESPCTMFEENILNRSDSGRLWDTCCLIAIWAWCGLVWLKMAPEARAVPSASMAARD